MRLFEAILDANRRRADGDRAASVPREQFADALPLAALTCIDPRLNRLLPEALGLAAEDFVWLRNAGNIISGPMSSTLRSLALACALKGAKEIAILGHTDCRVGKSTMLQITNALQALGVDRAKLPENLTEFLGLFASERQNVIKAVECARQSPLIGVKVPVHGALVDVQTGRLEWLVNGYQSAPAAAAASEVRLAAEIGGKEVFTTTLNLPAFHLGEMKFPEVKIGDFHVKVETGPAEATPAPAAEAPATAAAQPELHVSAEVPEPVADLARAINRALRYKIIGSDQKVYGPVSGAKLLQWLADERIHARTPIQIEGSTVWQTLASLAEAVVQGKIPLPPPIPRLPRGRPDKSP